MPMRPAIRDYGDRALLLECAGSDEVLAVTALLRDAALPSVVDIIPAARTVLVTVRDPSATAAVRSQLAGMDITAGHRAEQSGTGPVIDAAIDAAIDVVIDVVYDGEDIAGVARHLGIGVDEVIDAHTGTPWRVGFGGFAPGFAYLVGGDPRLRVPRHPEPRTRVPAGSVALAGEFSGVYPRESPGGWQLIGRTDAVLWDVERPHPALLTPGMWVRFRARTTPGATP